MPDPRDTLEALGRIAVGLQFGPGRVFEHLKPWAQRLALAAAPQWIPYLALGQSCHVLEAVPAAPQQFARCARIACGNCVICRRSTCLDHAFVASSGAMICYVCVSKQAPPPPPNGKPPPGAGVPPNGAGTREEPEPTPEQKAEARRVLGVKKNASWDQIHAAFKRKVKTAHPDLGGTDDAFREINAAHELLKKVHEKSRQKT